MNNPSEKLVYFDQNLIETEFTVLPPGYCFVYSKSHFTEIERSSAVARYLELLDKMKAKYLYLPIEYPNIFARNTPKLLTGSARDFYIGYLKEKKNLRIDKIGDKANAALAWFSGGQGISDSEMDNCIDDFLSLLLGDVEKSFDNLVELFPGLKTKLKSAIDSFYSSKDNIKDAYLDLLEQDNDIEKIRKSFNPKKGFFGNITGENILGKIWDQLTDEKKASHKNSADCFFGFKNWNLEDLPIFFGIIFCCVQLDLIGFQSEKKGRKPSKQPNVQSDAYHIGYGAYCDYLLSKDRKLVNRAKAIYEYKAISTRAILIDTETPLLFDFLT